MTKTMTKQRAHELLHHFAHQVHKQGWAYDQFIDNFEQVWGLAPDIVTTAADLVPDALEHVAHVVFFPTRRDR